MGPGGGGGGFTTQRKSTDKQNNWGPDTGMERRTETVGFKAETVQIKSKYLPGKTGEEKSPKQVEKWRGGQRPEKGDIRESGG